MGFNSGFKGLIFRVICLLRLSADFPISRFSWLSSTTRGKCWNNTSGYATTV